MGFRRLRQIPTLRSRVARKRQGIKTTDYNIKGSRATEQAQEKEVAEDKAAIKGRKVKS